MGWQEPQPSELEIELGIFEDNVKNGYARIKRHIAESEERLEVRRAAIQKPQASREDFIDFRVEEAFLKGLCRAQQHLIDTMGNEDAFSDEYWDKHCHEKHPNEK